MRKMLFVINAFEPDHEALDFAVATAAANGGTLTMLQIAGYSESGVPAATAMGWDLPGVEAGMTAQEEARWEDAIDRNAAMFMAACASSGVTGAVVCEAGNPTAIAVRESRFADMLIVGPGLSFTGEKSSPTSFVKDVLTGSECPVFLVPVPAGQIDEVVIAYDGSKASAFAARQFCYLLPALCTHFVNVLNVVETGKENDARQNCDSFVKWLRGYCPRVTYTMMHGNARDVLFNYFLGAEGGPSKMLVAGAYGRTALSRFFSPGATNLVLKATGTPVFVAHA